MGRNLSRRRDSANEPFGLFQIVRNGSFHSRVITNNDIYANNNNHDFLSLAVASEWFELAKESFRATLSYVPIYGLEISNPQERTFPLKIKVKIKLEENPKGTILHLMRLIVGQRKLIFLFF